MALVKEAKVKVVRIDIEKDGCTVSLANYYSKSRTFISLSMPQEEAMKFKIGDEYTVQVHDNLNQLEPHIIDHQ